MVIWSETTSAPSLPHSCFPFIFCSSIWFNLLFTEPCAVNPLVLPQLIDKDCALLCSWLSYCFLLNLAEPVESHIGMRRAAAAHEWVCRVERSVKTVKNRRWGPFDSFTHYFLLIRIDACVFRPLIAALPVTILGHWFSRCVRCNNMTD